MRLKGYGQNADAPEVRFTFDGRAMRGRAGEPLAASLLARGVRLMGRSFKYHRPRGVLTAGSEEPNALMTVGEGAQATPNVRATMQPVYDGMVAVSQNRWPSLAFDIGAHVGDRTAAFRRLGARVVAVEPQPAAMRAGMPTALQNAVRSRAWARRHGICWPSWNSC